MSVKKVKKSVKFWILAKNVTILANFLIVTNFAVLNHFISFTVSKNFLLDEFIFATAFSEMQYWGIGICTLTFAIDIYLTVKGPKE